MSHPIRSKRRTLAAVAIAALAAIPVVAIVGGNQAQAATAAPGDGTTSATAGASCWGIKQQHPASANGTYWLNTVALERPTQFYCDMTTDGGGWVLVGRGREGWTFNPFGQGSPTTLRTTVSGSAAFAPAALDTATITRLLDGQAVDTLTDGIRLERATNSAGTSTQDYRLFPQAKNWTWSLHAGQLLNKVVVDGTTYLGSNTWDTASATTGQTTNQLANVQDTRRLFTFAWASHNNKQGFSYGSQVGGGSNSATTHLWTNSNEGHPIPFTRVWIRPQVANSAAGFSPLPAGGLPAEARPANLNNKSEFANWGVVGMDHTNETTIEPWNTNVLSLRVRGDRTFVGGRFTGVQNGPTGSPVSQPYLAAFSIDGNFIDTFRPQVNGRVWDMVVTPDDKLIIAGDFTSVNGQPNTAGLAALDPVTGQVITTWKANIGNTSGRILVRGLDIHDGWIYAAGSFNRVTGGSWNQITVSSAINLNVANGSPGNWRPRLSGQGVRLRVTNDGTRVLLAGYFNSINNDTNHAKFAVTDAATGNPVAGIGTWTPSVGSGTKTYQQAVTDLPDGRMIVGGSEHNIQLWDRDRTQLLDAAVTKQGGDTQLIEVFDGKAYIGCHCGNWVYEGTNNYSAPTGFRSVERINLIGAWDTTTWSYDTSWLPSSLKGAKGEGAWAADRDSRGCLWVGGDLNRGGYSGNAAADWLGGFARFCPLDTTPPTTPTGLTATPVGTGVQLNWGASADASGTVSYDVYRDDRVIATVWGRTYTDPEVTGSHRYTVRATDARGNRSATPAPLSVNGPSPVIDTPVPFASAWRYLATGADQGTAWRANGFDDSAWPAGPGRLGWGMSSVATNVGAKPLTTYYRRTISVADPSAVRVLDLKLISMQGAVVYVNGVEAGRVNMPTGTITSTTPAASYLPSAQEQAARTLTIPGSLLVAGTNTIAVEVHTVTANAGRSLFDVQATLYGQGGDQAAPSAPALTASRGADRVDLSWTAATDDVALGGYLVRRDGQPLAVTGPLATSYVDGTVDLATAHTYEVTAFDAGGNATASNTVTVATVANPNLLAFKAPWRWLYVEGGPAAGWNAAGFDDATWGTGNAELGYGDNDEGTRISTAPTPRPLTAYFRTTVEVTDPAAFSTVLATLIRDDGAVLYVNGVEVGRDNLPAGPIAFGTPASRIISSRSEELAPVQFTIPASAFVAGTNVIAVEVHNSDRWSGDLSMDLKLTGQP